MQIIVLLNYCGYRRVNTSIVFFIARNRSSGEESHNYPWILSHVDNQLSTTIPLCLGRAWLSHHHEEPCCLMGASAVI